MILKSGNTILRGLKPIDLDWLFEVENEEKYWAFSGTLKPFSKAVLKDYISHSNESIFTAKQQRFVIEHKGISVGMIDLFDFSSFHKRAGVGILVLEAYQSQGIGSKALKMILEYAFKHLHLHQIYANIFTDNLNSIKLFTKHQFKLIGTKKDWIFLNGAYKDELLFQILNT